MCTQFDLKIIQKCSFIIKHIKRVGDHQDYIINDKIEHPHFNEDVVIKLDILPN